MCYYLLSVWSRAWANGSSIVLWGCFTDSIHEVTYTNMHLFWILCFQKCHDQCPVPKIALLVHVMPPAGLARKFDSFEPIRFWVHSPVPYSLHLTRVRDSHVCICFETDIVEKRIRETKQMPYVRTAAPRFALKYTLKFDSMNVWRWWKVLGRVNAHPVTSYVCTEGYVVPPPPLSTAGVVACHK